MDATFPTKEVCIKPGMVHGEETQPGVFGALTSTNVEPVTGIEPACPAWEVCAAALGRPCIRQRHHPARGVARRARCRRRRAPRAPVADARGEPAELGCRSRRTD